MSVETQIATLEEQVKHTDEKIDRVDETTQKIWGVLDGPGGVVTGVALNKQSLGRAWWWLGGISLAIVGGAVGLFFWIPRIVR